MAFWPLAPIAALAVVVTGVVSESVRLWTDVPRGEWVACLSMEGGVIFARNSANANEQSGCQPGDSIFVTPRIKR